MSQLPIDLDAEAIQYDGHWYTREELARRIKQMLDAGDFAVGKPSQALEQLTNVMASLRTLAFRLPPEMADQLNQVAARHGRTLGSLIRESLTVHLNLKGIHLMEGSMAGAATPAGPATPQPERAPGSIGAIGAIGRKATDPEMPVPVPVPVAPAPAPVAPPRSVVASVGSHPTPPGGIPMSALPADLRMTQPMPLPLQSQVIAGPGALKAAQPQPERTASVVVDKSIVTEMASEEEAASAVSLGGPKKKQPADDVDTIERGWFGR